MAARVKPAGPDGRAGAAPRSTGAPLRSVRRALDVLRAFEAPPHARGISDLARELGLSKGTVHLLAGVLEAEGFLDRDPATRRYQLGPAVFRLTAAAQPDLRLAARGPLERLYTDTSFPAYLAILVEGRAIIVEKAAPTLSFLPVLDAGSPVPLHCSALGKVLLAHAPPAVRESVLAGAEEAGGFPALTPASVMSPAALRAELEAVRRDELARDAEESLPGVFCLAAPVRAASGEVVAAVSVAAPAGSVPGGEGRRTLESVVRRTAETVSYRLGYRGPGRTGAAGAGEAAREAAVITSERG